MIIIHVPSALSLSSPDSLQDNVMLEKACMAVEEAAKGGGVYPEVLFEVAHQWYWLYEQSVGGGSSQPHETSRRCGANGGSGRRAQETSCIVLDAGSNMESAGMATVTASVTAATVVPVISVGSTIYQSHAMPGQAMAHAHGPGLHPYTTIQAHLPTVCTPQYLGHPLQHVPRPTVFPVAGAAYPQVRTTRHTTTGLNFVPVYTLSFRKMLHIIPFKY